VSDEHIFLSTSFFSISALPQIDLSGSNLGDDGLQLLMPHLIGLKDLRRLTLKQAGLSDWSAPQVRCVDGVMVWCEMK
jgi:hypothetical protein